MQGFVHEFLVWGREDGVAVGELGGPDRGAHFAAGEGVPVSVAVGVGHHVGEGGGGFGDVVVPEVVEDALAGLEGAVVAGDDVGDEVAAGHLVDAEVAVEQLDGFRGDGVLGHGAAPADVARVKALRAGEDELADGGGAAVGGYDEIAA